MSGRDHRPYYTNRPTSWHGELSFTSPSGHRNYPLNPLITRASLRTIPTSYTSSISSYATVLTTSLSTRLGAGYQTGHSRSRSFEYTPSYTPSYTSSATSSYTPGCRPDYATTSTSKYTPSYRRNYATASTSSYTPSYSPSYTCTSESMPTTASISSSSTLFPSSNPTRRNSSGFGMTPVMSERDHTNRPAPWRGAFSSPYSSSRRTSTTGYLGSTSTYSSSPATSISRFGTVYRSGSSGSRPSDYTPSYTSTSSYTPSYFSSYSATSTSSYTPSYTSTSSYTPGPTFTSDPEVVSASTPTSTSLLNGPLFPGSASSISRSPLLSSSTSLRPSGHASDVSQSTLQRGRYSMVLGEAPMAGFVGGGSLNSGRLNVGSSGAGGQSTKPTRWVAPVAPANRSEPVVRSFFDRRSTDDRSR
ncbi:uncharacterized protein C8A04DRAFT_28299 [Dichotomopilus funicola]|uniref:Uncharacterized protein n=1 Tax=Dichotomopilus funicola TaxID=1934379 RepID=A0AAN6V5L2_9PEZI|nr:hypothetical protein C8A04DRAFT_28299 [Dichotomopilus funicola]